MSSGSAVSDRLPFVEGAIAGGAAWLLGYVVTYLVVSADVRDSSLQRVIETFGGESATYEIVGWVFYNAHFVNTVFRNVPFLGSRTTSFVGGDGGFTALLYVIPVGLLLAAGVALGRYRGVTTGTEGALAGVAVTPGYLLLSVAGVFLFEVTVGDISGGPELLPALFLAGVVYPVVFACGGGALAGVSSG